jgi:hypothetical protein
MFVLQSTNRLLHRGTFLSGTLLMLLVLAACGVAEGTVAAPTPNDVIHPTSTSPALPAAPQTTAVPLSTDSANGAPTASSRMILTPVATTTLSGSDTPVAWQTYRSEAAGYTIEYPKEWSVEEQDGTTGTTRSIVTTFRPNGGGPLIIVTTQMQTPDQAVPLDMPNTQCQQVQGNRGIATRCLDTIPRTTTTTIVAQGKTYTITSAGKAMDQSIYQHILDSFAPFATPTSQAQTDLEPLLFQPGPFPTFAP